jgi:hypothetical protein
VGLTYEFFFLITRGANKGGIAIRDIALQVGGRDEHIGVVEHVLVLRDGRGISHDFLCCAPLREVIAGGAGALMPN